MKSLQQSWRTHDCVCLAPSAIPSSSGVMHLRAPLEQGVRPLTIVQKDTMGCSALWWCRDVVLIAQVGQLVSFPECHDDRTPRRNLENVISWGLEKEAQ